MKHILVIEDDLSIGNLLEEVLTRQGYRVSRAYSGTEGLLVLAGDRPDLVLLDLMLPGLPGEEVLPKLEGIPTIVVSAKVDVEDKVDLLLGGAADYITKPFDTQELLARVVAALRKSAGPNPQVLVQNGLRLDPTSHSVTAGGGNVHLTRTEYALLRLLMENPGQVLAKPVLLDRISRDTPDCTESSLKMHMSNLRKKLRSADGIDHIESVWGIGFRLRTE